MDTQLYKSLAARANDLVTSNRYQEAIEVLEELVQSDLPFLDRAMMCLNIAIVQDKMGNHMDSLESHTRAVELELNTDSYYAAQSCAAYYSQLGMYPESLRLYQELLRHAHVGDYDREIFRKNIETLTKLISKQME